MPDSAAEARSSVPCAEDTGDGALARSRFARAVAAASALVAVVITLGCGASVTELGKPSDGTDVDLLRYPGGIKIAFGPYTIPANSDAIWSLNTTLNTFHAFFDANAVKMAVNPGACNALVLARRDTLRPPDSLKVVSDEPDWTKWFPLMVCGSDSFTWELPPHMALHIGYHPALDLRAHCVSVASAPVRGQRVKVVGTVRRFDEPSQPGYLLSTLVAERHDFSLPPHQVTTLSYDVAVPYATQLVALLGEYHRRGTGMTVDVLDAGGTQLARAYDTSGAIPRFVSLATPIPVPQGGIIRITTTYNNTGDTAIGAGARWDDQEAFRLIAFHSGKPQPGPIDHWVFQR